MQAACEVLDVHPDSVMSVQQLRGKINVGGYERRSSLEEQTLKRAKKPLSEFQLRDPRGKQGSMQVFGIVQSFLSFTLQSPHEKRLIVRANLYKVTSVTKRSRIPICNLNDPEDTFIPTAAIGRMIAFNMHPECTLEQKCVVFSSPE